MLFRHVLPFLRFSLGYKQRDNSGLAEIGLTPSGRLQWEAGEGTELASLGRAFEADWREGLFILAADRIEAGASPTLRYWQDVAEGYVSGLCHISGDAERIRVEPPTPAERDSRLLMAPPMRGGEYLTSDVLLAVWEELDLWGATAAQGAGGLESFLRERAPKWHQVGRVCFHLAENKQNAARPFAFMASYTAGFGSGGRLKHLALRRALEQYAGENNRRALVNLLTPVEQAASSCDWVRELVDSGQIYQPLAWTPSLAQRFLLSVPDLEQSGLSVRLPDWWKRRPRPRVSVTIGTRTKPTLGMESMLDFDVAVALGDERLSPEELEALLSGGDGLILVRGQWVEVDREKLQEAIRHWEAIKKQSRDGQISFIEGMRLLAGAPKDIEDDGETDREQPWVDVTAGPAIKETLAALRDPGRAGKTSEIQGLKATLRPYQRDGVQWLELLTGLGLGGCLADDMGLGKTIQVLALLLARPPENKQPSLLVVPASLLGNWRDEAERFAPSLRLQFLHLAETSRQELAEIAEAPRERLAGTDLAVATYSMLTRQTWLTDVDWRFVILDEAQAIKNPSTRQTKAVKKLNARARIALTGTPVENRLGDLWSLFDFLNPGLLGSAKRFQAFVSRMQERGGDDFGPLRRLAGPYILRRLKTDRSIISDLPEKTETSRYCNLTKPQIKLYAQTVKAMESALAAADGIARRGLVLGTLMRLKQICNHPSQMLGDGDYQSATSGKFIRLSEICGELAERQDKVLIFTQFREIIEPIADHLAGVFGRPGLVLHGGTRVKMRKGIVEQFQADNGPPFFILSLKAGGTGLNLTAASHVIHFDRWWNPAVENQATDRAFRIGQKRNVLVHKFITRGTVEERIDAMIEEKRHLAGAVLDGPGEINLTELPDEELLKLVRLDVSRAEL